ncbi:MAG: pentapeptide repeat-containing protein [Pararhizobium sp.]
MSLLKFDVLNRFSGSVQFTAEIDCDPSASQRVKLGIAVKWAIRSRANLYGANLYGANLYGANLYGANLSRADLSGADLSWADLSGADLSGADLSGADLSGADLSGANLSRANLSRANLSGAKDAALVIARTRILPDEGAIIGWKKCRHGVIVKLLIPEDAKRSHAFGRKCRAEFADVLEVFGSDHGVSSHDHRTTYRAGERVHCDSFDPNWMEECAGGIHFFITRAEAEAY